jgi:catechol 2,3-dioxygenase-like lactoylglutathione lyase family enzyme
MELFVDDLDVSVAFYVQLLGFTVARRDDGYVSLRRGAVVLGLGPTAKLPDAAEGAGFSRQRLRLDKGAGVEIVFELDGVEQVESLYSACPSRGVVIDPLQDRPWGPARLSRHRP